MCEVGMEEGPALRGGSPRLEDRTEEVGGGGWERCMESPGALKEAGWVREEGG